MPEPDCFLRYRMRCNAEFYYVGKIPRLGIGRPSLQRGVVLQWFYLRRAMGTSLSEVRALPSDLLVLRSSGKSNGLPFASEAFLRRLGLVEELGTHKFAQILHTGNISSSLLMCSSHAG